MSLLMFRIKPKKYKKFITKYKPYKKFGEK